MEQIHNSKKRMPVIVSDSSESKWIGGGELMKDEISEICKPYDTQWMEAYSISKLITDRKALTKNIPEVTEYMNYPELSEILS
jgi:putative SOS response-associated peptidase YedK